MQTSESVSTFMKSPLVAWVKTISCDGIDYKTLCNGDFLVNIWLQIDPKFSEQHAFIHQLQNKQDLASRIKNLNILLSSIQTFYEDVLGQILILNLPDVVKLGKSPDEESNINELNNLLLLILGSAVQCEHKEIFIDNIKSLDVEAQHTIVECIKHVTDNPETIWSIDWNHISQVPITDQERMYSILIQNVKTLAQQRDEILQKFVNEAIEHEIGPALEISTTDQGPPCARPHLIVELADAKSRLRKILQEVEEKNEMLSEQKEELNDNKDALNRLRQENLELVQDARTAKAYRDEIDILKERVHKVERLESEIQRYKDRINELDFYRSRVEELREDNHILTETKTMLEEQLDSCRKRGEHLAETEADLLKYQSTTSELILARENNKEQIQSLLGENAELHFEKKANLDELSKLQSELVHLRTQISSVQDINLHDQLNSDAQTRVLHLELENNRLRIEVENCKAVSSACEEKKAAQDEKDSAFKISNLENKLDELNSEKELMASKFVSLESKRQELITTVEELEMQIKTHKINETKFQDVGQSIISTNSENLRLHRAIESLENKLHSAQQEQLSLENENMKLNTTLESLKLTVRKFHDLEKENTNLEADNHKLEQEKKFSEKENKRLKNAVEIKDSTIEDLSSRTSSLELEKKQLAKEMENLSYLLVRTKEQEKENRDLVQQVTVAKKTLAVLRQDLITEKITCHKLAVELERFHTITLRNQTFEEEINIGELERSTTSLAEEEVLNRLGESSSDLSLSQKLSLESIPETTRWGESSSDLSQSQKLSVESIPQTRSKNEYHSTELGQVGILSSTISDLERKHILLDEENQNLKNQTTTLKNQICAINYQLDSCQQKLGSANKQNMEMQSKLAKLEVEATLLKSQNSTLTSQSSNYQCQMSALEDTGKLLQTSIAELQDIQKSLLDDHETLQKIHSQLTLDYENLSANFTTLKAQHRLLRVEHGLVKAKLEAALLSQEKGANLKVVLDESLEGKDMNIISLKLQDVQMKDKIQYLEEEMKRMHTDYKTLQESKKCLKTENNELKLKHTKLQGDLAESRDQLGIMDLKILHLGNFCDDLKKHNTSLSDELTDLRRQVSNLLSEYHSLLVKYEEEYEGQGKKYLSEKLMDLAWQRNKLEQKFTEQAQQNSKNNSCDLRSRCSHMTPLSMRRTKSQQLSNIYNSSADLHTDATNHMPRTTDLYSSFHNITENDDIPVRDTGGLVTADADSNANLKQNNQLPYTNVEEITSSTNSPNNTASLPSFVPVSTVVENYTTVNIISNLSPECQPSTASPSSCNMSQNPAFRSPNCPRSAMFSSSDGDLSTPVFGSIMPRSGFRYSRNYGKNHASHNDSNLNCTETDHFASQGNVVNSASKDKNKSSVWYEYGCV